MKDRSPHVGHNQPSLGGKNHMTATGLLSGSSAHLGYWAEAIGERFFSSWCQISLEFLTHTHTHTHTHTQPPILQTQKQNHPSPLLSFSLAFCDCFLLKSPFNSLTSPRHAQYIPGKALPVTCHSFTESIWIRCFSTYWRKTSRVSLPWFGRFRWWN